MRRLCASTVAGIASRRSFSFQPRLKEYSFIMEDVLDSYKHFEKLGLGETVTPDIVNALAEECGKICTQTLFPLYQSADEQGCKMDKDGNVTTPKGFKEAYEIIRDGGWQGINHPAEFGGQGLPSSVGLIQKDLMGTANWAFMMYPGLSNGAATTLMTWGSPEQKEKWMKPLIEGTWSGTMCLTEPQAGSDLSQVKTKAEPATDGAYKLNGPKIFVSSGNHDLTPNIIHIVLARLPNAPEGTKGISLFLVPKHLVKPDGSLETTENVKTTGIEHKMGIKGNATVTLSLEDSIGYMIGAPNTGMKQMFTFMNMARLGTAIEGIAHAELAFQNALAYALERGAMRSLGGIKQKDKPADAIIHHASVKHAVLFAKAVAEGGRCFIMDVGQTLDRMEATKDPKEVKRQDGILGLLTPIAKGCLTELGLEAASQCVQVYGGHGYIRENGMEQILRDARISTLYEGTTNIQALDFIGRKVLMAKGNELSKFYGRMNAVAKSGIFAGGTIGANSRQLYKALKRWRWDINMLKIGAMRDRELVASASVEFLMYSGYLVLGYYWLRMANAAKNKIGKTDSDDYYKMKIQTCNFYFNRVFPRIESHRRIMRTPASAVIKVKNDAIGL